MKLIYEIDRALKQESVWFKNACPGFENKYPMNVKIMGHLAPRYHRP